MDHSTSTGNKCKQKFKKQCILPINNFYSRFFQSLSTHYLLYVLCQTQFFVLFTEFIYMLQKRVTWAFVSNIFAFINSCLGINDQKVTAAVLFHHVTQVIVPWRHKTIHFSFNQCLVECYDYFSPCYYSKCLHLLLIIA